MASRYKRPVTPADRARRDAAREEKLTALHEQLTEQVAALRSGKDWQAWLDVASRFHTYSFNNTLLIYAQRPQARAVAGYTAWQALGRQVDKGEKGIQILAPVTRRATADVDESHTQREPVTFARGPSPNPAAGTDASEVDGASTARHVVSFRIAYVWDVDQTSGDPLPEQPRPELLAGQAPEGLWDSLAGLAEARGFTVERSDCGPANGWTDYTSRFVRIRPDVDDAQAVKTLAHEIGHVLLHDPTDFVNEPAAGAHASVGHATTASCRGIKEIEAESVAYLVGTSHGLATDSYTFPYVAGWAGSVDAAEPERVVAATGQRVLRAAGTILDATQDERVAADPDEQLTARVAAGRDRATAVRAHAETTLAIASGSPITPERLAALIAIHEEATHWYADQLASGPADHGPRAYLADRGFPADALRQYRVGHAPAQWTAVTDHLRANGHPDDAIEESGLAMRSSRGNLIDRFRDRIMLPVADETGAVVGFVGRAAPNTGDAIPKYLNSPDTPIYRKSAVLYGLAQGSEALAAGARPVIVEGPLDAIAVNTASAGRYVGVAPCGVNLTDAQIAALDRVVPLADRGVAVAFDSDKAGRAAAARAFAPLRATGGWAYAAQLPDGQDPSGLYQSGGSLALISALDTAEERPLADIVINDRLASFTDRLDTAEGRVLAVRAAAAVIATLPPEHVRRQVVMVVERVNVDPGTVTAEVTDAVTADGGVFERPGRRERRENTYPEQSSRAAADGRAAAAAAARMSYPQSTAPSRTPRREPTTGCGRDMAKHYGYDAGQRR